MKIKLFSDMVCPYCYVGKLRLDQAIERLGLTDVEVEFKAFQLHPTSPADYSMPIYDFIRQAYGPGAVGNPVMRQQVMSAGKSVGLDVVSTRSTPRDESQHLGNTKTNALQNSEFHPFSG